METHNSAVAKKISASDESNTPQKKVC